MTSDKIHLVYCSASQVEVMELETVVEKAKC